MPISCAFEFHFSEHLLQARAGKPRAAQRTLLREPEGLDPGHAVAMEDMTACKGTRNRLTQWLQAHSAVLLA